METARINIHEYAMRYGTYMGIYWILKFALFPLGLRYPLLELLFMLLTLGVPVLGYLFARRFRPVMVQAMGGFPFFSALSFCVLMYFFAALLTAAGHYVYFAFIDGGFLFDEYAKLLQQAETIPGMEALTGQMDTALATLRGISPIQFTIQLMGQNVFYGMLMSIPTAWAVCRKIKNEQSV